ncbi:hypothetical protein [Paenibacillus pinihumi]|uniref:hypothetical protein n=1 Tax=Paenibacillus pinihumi TaxID=669462 RepID=UPI000406951F|nr:hypothetical protein [Paenibacillus pinihumi]
MAKITEKLKLIQPELTDSIQSTIDSIAQNMRKLDDQADEVFPGIPTNGIWKQRTRIWNSAPAIGAPVGWVNVREGQMAPSWNKLTLYNTGQKILTKENNGRVYTCIQSGYSGLQEPVFPLTAGSEVEDTRGKTAWSPIAARTVNEIVLPGVANGFFYVSVISGRTGSTEPVWTVVNGSSVNDGEVVWLAYKIAKWKEAGESANFRPFGIIG